MQLAEALAITAPLAIAGVAHGRKHSAIAYRYFVGTCSAPAGGCGCNIVGEDTRGGSTGLIFVLLAGAVFAVRRRTSANV